MSNFIDMCRTGEAQPEDIDDFIDEWHDNPGSIPLYTFLGMTKEEYSTWVEDATSLFEILKTHDQKIKPHRTTSVS
jgi:hypothetical protein